MTVLVCSMFYDANTPVRDRAGVTERKNVSSENTPTCAICGEPIARNERWEYWHVGSNTVGTPIHSACRSTLVRQIVQDIHTKPGHPDRRNEQSE